MDFRNYVEKNFIEILRRSTVLEGYMFSRLETEEILVKGYSHRLDAKQIDEVLNLKHAWSWVLEEHEYNPMILEDLHEIVSSGVTVNPNLEGWFRPADYIVRISGTSYVPPTASRVDALNGFGEKLSILVNRVNGSNSKEEKIRLILSFYLYLMKRQFFHDCNKRTAYLFTNFLLKDANIGVFLYLPKLSSEGVYLKKLKRYYEGGISEESEFISYLKRYYIKEI